MDKSFVPVSNEEQRTPPRAWIILAITYLASIMAPMVQFKIPPLASWIIPAFHMNHVTFGYLMSSMTIIGVILAFPAAFICRNMGLKKVMLLSVACLGIGSAVGAVTTTLSVLMISRMIEGVGIGLIGVAAPTCVSVWFPVKTRGLALGIWATWVPFGIVLMFNLAPVIASTIGFKAVFWLCSLLCLFAFVMFALIFKVPESGCCDMHLEGTFLQSFKYLKSKNIWILGGVFFIFSFCTLGITNTFYNSFLEKVLGFSVQASGSITSFNMLLAFISAPLAGIISDKLSPEKKHYAVIAIMVMVLISVFFMFVTGPHAIAFMWIFIVIQGIAGGEGGGACRPIAPLMMGGSAMGATMGMAVLQFSQNLGQCFGSPIFGWTLEHYGWLKGNMMLQIPLLIIGIILSLYIAPGKKKKVDLRDEVAAPDMELAVN